MKNIITLSEFRDGFYKMGRENQFSYEALETMFDYYEEMENECGIEIEYDVIAFCCEWTEYEPEELYNDYRYIYNFDEWMEENGDIYTPEEKEDGEPFDDFITGDFMEEIEQYTTILKVKRNTTYLVMNF